MLTSREKGMFLLLLALVVVLPIVASAMSIGGFSSNQYHLELVGSLLLVVWCWGIIGPFSKLLVTIIWRPLQPPPRLKQAEVILRLVWVGAAGLVFLFSSAVELHAALTPSNLRYSELWVDTLGQKASLIAGGLGGLFFIGWMALWFGYVLKRRADRSQNHLATNL